MPSCLVSRSHLLPSPQAHDKAVSRVRLFRFLYKGLDVAACDDPAEHDVTVVALFIIANNVYEPPGNSGPYKDGFFVLPKIKINELAAFYLGLPSEADADRWLDTLTEKVRTFLRKADQDSEKYVLEVGDGASE